MELVKKLKDCAIYKKKSGRYAVLANNKKYINGEEKVKILLAEGLIKLTEPKQEEVAEESTEAESQEESAQA